MVTIFSEGVFHEKPSQPCRRTRLILILLCIVLAAAMLWCALSLVLKIGTYSSRTVGDDKPAEEVPVEPADLEPTVAENSYDPAGFYEEGGFKRYKSADTIASVGVDVSSHQQDIDWELVAANGVEFAMIRVGYRGYTEGEIQPDDYFTQNIEGALAAGLDVGVYFFSQALDEKEAIDEANFVLESIKDYPLSYPVIFDWEDHSGGRPDRRHGLCPAHEKRACLLQRHRKSRLPRGCVFQPALRL